MRKKAIEMNKRERPIWNSLSLFPIAKATVKEFNIIPVRYKVGNTLCQGRSQPFGEIFNFGHEIFKQHINCLPIICLIFPTDM